MAVGPTTQSSAVVVLSGGQDSTTCLAWAKNRYAEVSAITFDYGQRHRIEIDAAKKIATLAGVARHRIITVSSLAELGGNALISSHMQVEKETKSSSLPNTFVPGRNLIFLTLSAAWAYQIDCLDIVTGVCQTDYSGYPDCRNNTIIAQNLAINLGMEKPFRIHTPLMWLTKSESILLARREGGLDWLAWRHTCYNGVFPPCGECPACVLRQQGFREANLPDPLLNREMI